MKNLLLVFVVLLFLLTLLSSFGGSIRTEPFYDGNPPAITSLPTPPVSQQRTSGAASSTTPTSGAVYNQADINSSIINPSSSTVVQSSTGGATGGATTAGAAASAGVGATETVIPSQTNMPKAPQMTDMTIPPPANSAVQTAEHYANFEKVDVPAPFFDKDFGAPL